MRAFTVATLMFFSASAFANDSLSVTVVISDKTTKFEVPSSTGTEVITNGHSRKALKQNVDHAFKVAREAAKEKSNDVKLCPKRRIEMTLHSGEKRATHVVGCVGSKTPVASKLTELANLLSLM